MILSFRFLAGLGFILLASGAIAQNVHQGGISRPYAGMQTREVKSLSAQDIVDLREGRGWGLALRPNSMVVPDGSGKNVGIPEDSDLMSRCFCRRHSDEIQDQIGD